MMLLEHTSEHVLASIKTTAACDKQNDVGTQPLNEQHPATKLPHVFCTDS